MIWWPTPYKAPNFTDGKTLLPPKPITAQSYKKPKERLQQGDWSSLTNEPVAPFALNTIVQGSKPILPIKQVAPTTVTTPQIPVQPVEPVQAPKQLPPTGAWQPSKDLISQLWSDISKWATIEQIKSAYPEFSSLDDKTVSELWSDIAKWASVDEIIKAYPELWINQPTQSFKTATQTQQWWWMFDYQVFWKMNPNSVEDASVWWFAGNVWKSAVNMISDVGNMITNPVQTAKWLWWMVTGAWVNAAKFLGKEFLGKTEEEMSAKLQSKIDKWGVIWMLASTVKWAENIADSAWEWAVVNRYGSLDAAKRTAYEDPVGFISDIATLVTWVGGAVKWWATAATKIPMIAKSSWTVSKLWKVADIAWDIAKVADYADPATLTMKGYMKAWEKVLEWAKAIPKIPWKILPKVEKWVPTFTDKAISATLWLDADTVRRFKDSPEIVKALDEWKITKESIKQDLVDAVDTVSNERKWVGSAYQDIYTRPDVFNAKEITNDINSSLAEQWVKIKNWKIVWFDTTKMTWLTDQAKSALKSKYEDVISTLKDKWEINIEQLHNIRKDLYNTAYQDWFISKKAPWVSKVSDVLNERLKKIPWFSEADAWFKEASDLLNEIKWNVLNKEWDFKWTLKSMLWERGQKRLDVLEKHFPWLKDKIETLSAYDDYLNTRNQKKVWLYEKAWTAWASAVGWFLLWWPIWAIVSWIAWPILSDFVRDPIWFKNYIVKKAGKDIANKIQLWTKLTNAETVKAKVALQQVKSNPNLALEFKPQTATPITPTGKVQEKVVIPPKKLPKSQTIVAEKGTAVSPAEQAKFAEQKAKQQEITAKKQQVEQAKQQAESFERKASDYQKVLEDSKDYKKLWVFDVLWGWWVRDWDYITKYWTITDTQRWTANLLEYKIWDKWYKARDVDVFEKGATPEIIPVKESDDIVKARQDIKDMQADKQRRNLYVNQLLEEMNLKSIDDLPADKLPEFAKILRTRNRSWEWMTRYENFVKENKINKWSAIADKKVKIPLKK